MSFRLTALSVCLLGLGACATPLPPVYTAADVTAFSIENTSVAISPASIVLPGSGSASYTGQFASPLGGGGDVIGAVDINTDFAGNTVSGALSDITILGHPDVTDQALAGQVDMTGTITGTTLAATGTGNLTAVAHGFSKSGQANVTLGGQFRDFLGFYDAISGTIDFSVSDFDISATGIPFYAR